MSTFNFRKAVHSVKTEGEFWHIAVKSGVSIKYFKCDEKDSVKGRYEFTNLGDLEGHDAFLVKGVMGWFNERTFQDDCYGLGKKKLVQIAICALFRAYHAFQKVDGSWIDASKPSEFTIANFFDLIWKNTHTYEFTIGHYTRFYETDPSNMQNLRKIAKKLNMGMNEVAVWCGMDACMDESRCGDRLDDLVCKDYVHGIAKCFETKKRKRDDAEEENK